MEKDLQGDPVLKMWKITKIGHRQKTLIECTLIVFS